MVCIINNFYSCALADREVVANDYEKQQKILKIGRDGLNSNGTGGSITNESFAGSVGIMFVIVDTETSLKVNCSLDGTPVYVPETPHSTWTTAFIDPPFTKRKLVIANVGDCRAVLSENGVAVQLSRDHKPDNEEEKKRIQAAGSFVHKGR